jgi:hypothetical protein
VPQDEQNAADADCSLPHAGHVVHKDAPHTWQKRALSETSAPQETQELATPRVYGLPSSAYER